jgi:hypothetical protein
MLFRKAVLTPPQLRAARALLGWSREDLAEKSSRDGQELRGTVQKLRRALETAGAKFIDADDQDAPGVRLGGIKKR